MQPDDSSRPADAQAALWPQRRERRWLLLLLGAGLALRIVLILALRTYEIRADHDNWYFAYEYGRIGRSIAVGKGYSSPYELDRGGPTTKGCPFFPAYLSVLFRVFGVYSRGAAVAMHVGNSLASIATAFLVFIIGRRLFGPAVGWIAAALFTFDPTTLWYSFNSVWEGSFSCLGLTALLALFLWLRDHLTWRGGAVGGLVAGIVAHVHVVALPTALACAVWLLVRAKGRRRAALWMLAVMGIVGALAIAPWSVRNSLIERRPVLMRGHLTVFVARAARPHEEADRRIVQSGFLKDHTRLTNIGDREYTREFTERLATEPKVTVRQYLHDTFVRSVRFWIGEVWVKWESSGAAAALAGIPLQSVKIVVHTAGTALALAGFLIGWRRRADVWLPFAHAAGYFPIHGLIHCTMMRYRFPIHGSLVLLGSVALWHAWQWASRRFTRRTSPAP